MGLSAVVFGKLWRDARAADRPAAAVTLVLGALRGQPERTPDHPRADPAVDRDPRLVLAVPRPGRGARPAASTTSPTFPGSFLFLGQGYSLGGIPTQLPIFVVGGVGVLGAAAPHDRRPGAVGHRLLARGARYAGLPVDRRVALVYVLSGLVASLAAIIYVAHLGQAKADAGTGYELSAITAVVLGRHVDLRRPGERPRDAAGPVRDRRAPATACGWPTCPPSWPAS